MHSLGGGMGCIHGKCCIRYPRSSDGDSRDLQDAGLVKNPSCREIISQKPLEVASIPSRDCRLQYSAMSQRGYYPESPEKENQDSFCIRTQLQGNPNVHFFGVFDGHGQFGSQCSSFVRDRLPELLACDTHLLDDPIKAYDSAFSTVNHELHNSEIDDTMSGSTAITVLVIDDTLYVANVGDSRAVIAVSDEKGAAADDLSCDQTPFRKDEYDRVKLCGARVLSVDQVEGLKDPSIQTWSDEATQGSDPPRLWVQNGMYPGTAFTRSVGDSTAERIGVVAVPEISVVQLTAAHLFFVVASDGVFEFLSSQAVVDMAASHTDPREACAAIVGESYKLWLENESRTDDITVILVQIKDFGASIHGGGDNGVAAGDRTEQGRIASSTGDDVESTKRDSGSQLSTIRISASESQLVDIVSV